MPGPGKKPPQLKVIAGTGRKDRETIAPVDLPLVTGIPNAPDWLPNAHAVKEWNHLAPILSKLGLLTEGGLSALGVMCALHGKIVQLFNAGESPTGHMLAQYRNLINDFGLTPVAQGKVRGGSEKEKPNKFAGVGKKA